MQYQVSPFVLVIALTALLWRLLDFLDEALAGAMKMSLGPFVITGYSAAIIQVAIITALLITIYLMVARQLRKKANSPLG